ncbi:YwqJ-related putative deaminase [Gymnodinialimonas sp. 2305UL16-5]|uniref:YwqJ-related putative deaminase n=1 Tax=Gymnodinialimonas mytili TaxID=3126503 RepID=UPI00309C7EEB
MNSTFLTPIFGLRDGRVFQQAGLGGQAGAIAGNGGTHLDARIPQMLSDYNRAYNDEVYQNLMAYAAQLHTLGVLAGVVGTEEEQAQYRAAVVDAAGSYFEGLLQRAQRQHWVENSSPLDAAATLIGLVYQGSGALVESISPEDSFFGRVGENWSRAGDILVSTDPERLIFALSSDFIESIWDACVARWDQFWDDFDREGLLSAMARLEADADFLIAELAIDVALGIATGGAAVAVRIVARRVATTASRVVIRAIGEASDVVPDARRLTEIRIDDADIDETIVRQVLDEENLRTRSERGDLSDRAEVEDPGSERPSGSGNGDGHTHGAARRTLSPEMRRRLGQEQQGMVDEMAAVNLGNSGRGPVLTSVIDPDTGDVFHGINGGVPPSRRAPNRIPNDLHPVLRSRIDTYNSRIAENDTRNTFPDGMPVNGTPGHHSEIWALNQALNARERAGLPVTDDTLSELFLSNRRITGSRSGQPIVRCPDCGAITAGANDISADVVGVPFRE